MTSIHVRRLQSRVERTAARLVDLAERERLSVADLAGARLPWYAVRNQAGNEDGDGDGFATVFIFDEIGGSLGVTAKQFVAELEEITAPVIRLRINSPGGSVFDAIAIYNALKHHPARVEVYVDSLAASAASVIATAGDEVIMMPGSQLMIHDASALEDGNAEDHGKMQTFLDRQSENIADLYQMKGGGTLAEWRDLMKAETWMFAREAVQMGLADRISEYGPVSGDADLEERMQRRHDLGYYRYAGRRAAPAPTSHRIAISTDGARTSARDSSSDGERRLAAQQRAAAGPRRRGAEQSSARMAAFPATLRAELVEHGGQQRYHVTGHASVVETPYEMWDAHGPYMEVIDARAFDRTLAAGPDVAFLVNHRGVTMARTTNGSLKLSMDGVGLAVEAWLNPKRQDVTDLVVAIQDRDITEMSFAFMLGDGGGKWSSDFSEFRVTDADIDRGDVSAVNYGANPYTDVAARAREVLADLDHLPAGAARAAMARLKLRADLTPATPPAAPVRAVDAGDSAGRSLVHVAALLDED
ncbi:ATP-dependent Clp protease proteolytic subunit [Micromonospora sp. WMMD1102]|uniref:head maturation protease, ClpP-related n=1 Tax=Micromonospora sp. WMMD1102 TaxID=3016105 RepID=UPI0024154C0B|nr:head maturation protease, ClpP-related [Micromonospora sp. WMMD1102]MDG4784346.1 ATP-dependent Clp protease proteolytic subunit [Micromonospora sp. WMMD1102]MDG4784419.1 ATP-dependent Clp protease proteolytic subunit [Micromonospora sp. WMMD1102]